MEVDKKIKRVIKEWLNIYVLPHNLREAIVKRITLILHLDRGLDVLLAKVIFEWNEELNEAAADLEEELLREVGLIETVKR